MYSGMFYLRRFVVVFMHSVSRHCPRWFFCASAKFNLLALFFAAENFILRRGWQRGVCTDKYNKQLTI